uniref:Rhodanese domain-containing protein n=1 Tax=Chlamydomonas leiostraca TaxID=1034604 RepID=A0A7S0RVU8_9CHLO|mmetsp:Transcript_32713/g.82997  ORF Transcript_32713/g.82997 Transcript_32713/m.82997 type:complete len:263 (+) Transcript_32713:72-860(+)|eukprot:CAMPEP_0202861424 /NCGR_PEP_ID=MMETSP1391-20130828/2830_1 /ASSEMBLY_ACC=CAM_ASM_000867 /TAXON_ID=1034604 /ORGANISM="Chlamydomonas leiostraca, Strain SAG 11-49" /LENGTH=262 /DNA_ID=CAMNT_0049540815 /DNA_START=42 /DNA_END=830 /DNA_ORIENTATION=-
MQVSQKCHLSTRPTGTPRVRPFTAPRSQPNVSRRVSVRAAEASQDITQLTYFALGGAAATFLTTFFVLPKLYDKNTDWNQMLVQLRGNGVPSVTPAEAAKRAGRSVLLDVRLPAKYEEWHGPKAVNVPLYLPIQKWDLPSIIRRAGFAAFGVYGTELNPGFAEGVAAVAGKGREVLVICETGGTIDAKPGNANGTQSRSLKAIWYLQQAGIRAVHVQGGYSEWLRQGLPLTYAGEDGDDDSDADGAVPAQQRQGFKLPMFSR